MTYNTENRTEPTPVVRERSSNANWLMAGIVVVAAIVGFVIWGLSGSPVSTSPTPQVENNVTVEPPAPATTMDAQPTDQAPAATTPPAPAAPAATPPAPATTP